MRATVTAEWPAWAVTRLEALGYTVTTAGWGQTRQVLDADAYAKVALGAELLVTEIETVDAALLDTVGTVRLVATARGGPSNVDLDACTQRGIPVLFTPARNADSVADFTMGVMLALARRIPAGQRQLRSSGWLVDGELPYLHFRGPELAGRTLGLIGYGAIGRAVAQRAQAGFGMRVIYTDPVAIGSVSLETLLAEADVVSLHCARTPETVGLIGAVQLAALRPSAYLLNTAGGGMIDEVALVAALRQHRLIAAALDVFAVEPLDRDSPLLAADIADRLILTPHLAGASDDVPTHHAQMICDDIQRWQRGERPVHLANPGVALTLG